MFTLSSYNTKAPKLMLRKRIQKNTCQWSPVRPCIRVYDVPKKMLAVVVSDVEIENEYQFERRMIGSSPDQLRSLAGWLLEKEAEEEVMESTAKYRKPVWEALERYWKPIREKREA